LLSFDNAICWEWPFDHTPLCTLSLSLSLSLFAGRIEENEEARKEQKDEGFRRWRARGYLRRELEISLSSQKGSGCRRNGSQEWKREREGRDILRVCVCACVCVHIYIYKKRQFTGLSSQVMLLRVPKTPIFARYIVRSREIVAIWNAWSNIIEDESVYKVLQRCIFLKKQIIS